MQPYPIHIIISDNRLSDLNLSYLLQQITKLSRLTKYNGGNVGELPGITSQTIGRWTGIGWSTKTITALLKQLQEIGAIEVEFKKGEAAFNIKIPTAKEYSADEAWTIVRSLIATGQEEKIGQDYPPIFLKTLADIGGAKALKDIDVSSDGLHWRSQSFIKRYRENQNG